MSAESMIDNIYTRYSGTNIARTLDGKTTASSTQSERAAALALLDKIYPGETFRIQKNVYQVKFGRPTEWNVWTILEALKGGAE